MPFRLICHWYWPHRFAKWRKAIFKLKFSSINLLMTIAVVAAFIWENTRKQQL
jgi:hypothetical protein